MATVMREKRIKNQTVNEYGEFIEKDDRIIKNPFNNLADFVLYYWNIYKRNDNNELLCFADVPIKKNEDKVSKWISPDDMSIIMPSMFFSSNEEDNDDSWMIFDESELNKALHDSFFEEYNNTVFFKGMDMSLKDKNVKKQMICGKRKYPFLEIYTYYKLQANAICKLEDMSTAALWYDWCYNDAIDHYLWPLGFYEIIADVYINKGKNWFYNTRQFYPALGLDAVMYKWATLGVVSCKKTGKLSDTLLKKDLSDIYSELLIACVRTDSMEKHKVYLDYIQECIMNFDDEKILNLSEKLSSLEHENCVLLNDKKTMEKSMETLKMQIVELQKDTNRTDEEKAEAIAKRIYAMMPEEEGKNNNSTHEFTEIWSKLSEETKEDINRSVRFYEEIKYIDVAIFLMIRNIEREFAKNFFEPFHKSAKFKKVENSLCSDRHFEKTHDMLRSVSVHPTIGSIPYIGRAVKSKKAIDASKVIAEFARFLGSSKESFIDICKSLDNYKVGIKKNKIVDVRNVFAHGNDDENEAYDESSYDDLSTFLYEPPLRIMFKIIQYSRR